jgi:serine/threonine protein phosphatase 1
LDTFREIIDKPPRIFVVGDIHGCLVELEKLISYLRQSEGLKAEDLIVFLGDYIDRGDDSKEVVDFLLAFQKERPSTVFLKGNHEDMLMDYLGFDGHLGRGFIQNGGSQTLESYGFSIDQDVAAIKEKMPSAHLEFYKQLDRYVLVGDHVLVHAGLNPLRDLEDQVDEELFWIRDEFLMNIHYFEKTIIFGHTPHRDVFCHLPFKVGIDTGLVYGNMLTCLELNESNVFQIKQGGRDVVVSTLKSKEDPR